MKTLLRGNPCKQCYQADSRRKCPSAGRSNLASLSHCYFRPLDARTRFWYPNIYFIYNIKVETFWLCTQDSSYVIHLRCITNKYFLLCMALILSESIVALPPMFSIGIAVFFLYPTVSQVFIATQHRNLKLAEIVLVHLTLVCSGRFFQLESDVPGFVRTLKLYTWRAAGLFNHS